MRRKTVGAVAGVETIRRAERVHPIAGQFTGYDRTVTVEDRAALAKAKSALSDIAFRSLRWLRSPIGLRAWLRQRDLIFHAALLSVLVLAYGFFEIAEAVSDASRLDFDDRVLIALREPGTLDQAIGPTWFENAFVDITALGSATVITGLTITILGILLLQGRFRVATFIVVATLGGALLSHLLKGFYDRPRPELALRLVQVSSASFPSGHSLAAALLYPTLGAMAAQLMSGARLKTYALTVAALLTLLVGFSRVYLGVHYPSDVLAGWCVGLAWALMCWIVLRHVERSAARAKARAPLERRSV